MLSFTGHAGAFSPGGETVATPALEADGRKTMQVQLLPGAHILTKEDYGILGQRPPASVFSFHIMQIPVTVILPPTPRFFTMALESDSALTGDKSIYHFASVAMSEQDCMIRALNHMSKYNKDVYSLGLAGTPWRILNASSMSYEEIQRGFKAFDYPPTDEQEPLPTTEKELGLMNTLLAYCIKNKDTRTAAVLEPYLNEYERELLANAMVDIARGDINKNA